MNANNLGPLDALLQDPTIHTIMVNGFDQIYISRQAFLIEKAEASFVDNAHLLRVIDYIVAPSGQQVNESHPIIEVRLPDRSQVHIVIPPIALDGPTMTIRKGVQENEMPTFDTLIQAGTMSTEMVDFLRACVQGRMNILVCGGSGSGKTTLLNLIANCIPDNRRIILVEKESDLILKQPHVVRLEARPPNIEGKGEITLTQLVESAARMRPDSIVCGNVNNGEIYPLLQAISGGADGSMFGLHANGPQDALAMLEMLSASANPTLPLLNIRQQIAHALNLIVEIEIMPDGWRRVVRITEVVGTAGDFIQTADIFTFLQTGVADDKITGVYAPQYVPTFAGRLQSLGIQLPPAVLRGTPLGERHFDPRVQHLRDMRFGHGAPPSMPHQPHMPMPPAMPHQPHDPRPPHEPRAPHMPRRPRRF